MYDAVTGDRDAKEFFDFVAQIVTNTLAITPPQFIKPFFEQIFNFDLFRWGKIEQEFERTMAAELRVGNKTTHLAKEISKAVPRKARNALSISPKRIDKLFRDMIGGSYDLISLGIDAFLEHRDPVVDPAGTDLNRLLYVLGVDGFAPDAFKGDNKAAVAYTRYTEAYYALKAEAAMAGNTMREYETREVNLPKYNKLKVEYDKELQLQEYLKPFQREIQDINKELKKTKFREYHNVNGKTRKLHAKEKRHKINQLLTKRNKVMMDAVIGGKKIVKGNE